MTTRAIEWLFALMMIAWGGMLLVPGDMMTGGGALSYFLNFAPEWFWGGCSVVFGFVRLTALVINGHWRRTPIFRMAGAIFGGVWWGSLTMIYGIAIYQGAKAFPMYACFFLFIAFEYLSAYRCGQDAAAAHSFRFDFLTRREATFTAHNRGGEHASG